MLLPRSGSSPLFTPPARRPFSKLLAHSRPSWRRPRCVLPPCARPPRRARPPRPRRAASRSLALARPLLFAGRLCSRRRRPPRSWASRRCARESRCVMRVLYDALLASCGVEGEKRGCGVRCGFKRGDAQGSTLLLFGDSVRRRPDCDTSKSGVFFFLRKTLSLRFLALGVCSASALPRHGRGMSS